MKPRFFFLLIIFVLLGTGCSIEINQDSISSPSSQATSANPSLPAFKVPVTWAHLNLTGKLIYLTAGQSGNSTYMRIQALDLVTGAKSTIYKAPENGFIYSVTVSPDSKQLIMALALPPGPDLSTHQQLYSMPLDGSASPRLLLTPPTKDDEYFQPEWSPDGKYIYFSHVNFQRAPMPKQIYPVYEIFRMTYPDGQLEKLVDRAYWPRLSADMSSLVYISLDPFDGRNNLFVANADGSNAKNLTLLSPGIPDIIDAPIFSPDGQSILFSGVVPVQASQPTWLEKILGVTVVSAHVVPSDWWSLPRTGGPSIQITHIMVVGLFASISPDKQYVASYCGGGIFVMKPDGTESTMLIGDVGGRPGTVSWIP